MLRKKRKVVKRNLNLNGAINVNRNITIFSTVQRFISALAPRNIASDVLKDIIMKPS